MKLVPKILLPFLIFFSIPILAVSINDTVKFNMNGRMYDPIISRILAPDNFVQDETNAQNFNRYSYVINNPLRWTDPSGWLYIFPPETEKNFIKPYENEINSRLVFLNRQLNGLDEDSDDFQNYTQQINEYNKILNEINDLRNDPNNIYTVFDGASLDNNVQGIVKYGGIKDNMNKINIYLAGKTNESNLPFYFDPLAHELKHSYQYYEGRLGFLLYNNFQRTTTNSKSLEREAFMRGNMFLGKTMTKNNSFNLSPNLDINKVVLDKHYGILKDNSEELFQEFLQYRGSYKFIHNGCEHIFIFLVFFFINFFAKSQTYKGTKNFGELSFIFGDSICLATFYRFDALDKQTIYTDTLFYLINEEILFLNSKEKDIFSIEIKDNKIEEIGIENFPILYIFRNYKLSRKKTVFYDTINKQIICNNICVKKGDILIMDYGLYSERFVWRDKEALFFFIKFKNIFYDKFNFLYFDNFPLLIKRDKLIPIDKEKNKQCFIDNGFYFPTMKKQKPIKTIYLGNKGFTGLKINK